MTRADDDCRFMSRALELAERGRGRVEPNPMVGCVVVRDGQIVAEGWHRRFGEPHAEIEALGAAADAARGATIYATLEPCCHEGKTPPCTRALIKSGVTRVVIGCRDPHPKIAGGGLAELRAAGIEVVEGVCHDLAQSLIASFAKLVVQGLPWVIAKWAMTLDGKLATRTGNSQWISGETARQLVHRLRGEVDAILIGSGTAAIDDPLLTARPAGPRTATRLVLDSNASLSPVSKLVTSIDVAPLLVAVSESSPSDRRQRLEACGAEVLVLQGQSHADRLQRLLEELARRQFTNLLVEGGSRVLGTLFDLQAIDEVHAFVAGKLVGGRDAPGAIAGAGVADMADAISLRHLNVDPVGDDLHLHGRLHWK